MINSNILPGLHPTRRLEQGDPLSALLLLIMIEPLGSLLRTHEVNEVRLTASGTTTGVLFADDSTLFNSSIANLLPQLELVQEYCAGSGAKVEIGKSTVMASNRSATCPRVPGLL